MSAEPSYPASTKEAFPERADSAPMVPEPGRPRPAQGDHRAAGGRPEHLRPDGGTGIGQAPAGWPRYSGD